VKHYEKSGARFVSEFGMQSFPSVKVARRFCPPAELNVYSPAMEARQKNPAGNAIMADYMARRYRFAGDYAGQAYLSQLNQAYCMKVAVEHWRRSQPRTMGALYWQLNDVWPAISWSSLEFGGGWKPLHHVARRFFAPILLSAHIPGDETRGIGNRLKSDVRGADLYTVSDHPVAVTARLRWELWLWPESRVLRRGARVVRLIPGEARRREQLDFARAIAHHGRENLLLRLRLEPRGLPAAEDVVLFTAPRHLDLHGAPISLAVKRAGAGRWSVELESAAYHHGVWLDLPGSGWAASDNSFDLLPGVPRRIELTGVSGGGAVALRKALRVQSLVHAYQPSGKQRT
jgi:beta-mannosidase